MNLSGTELRDRLQDGSDIPEWFSYPSVIRELRKSYPAMGERGFNVYISGESSIGKSSLGNALAEMLLEDGSRPVTVLDDDALSSETVNLVAREASRNGGAVISVSTDAESDGVANARNVLAGSGVFVGVLGGSEPTANDDGDVALATGTSPGNGARSVFEHLKTIGLIA